MPFFALASSSAYENEGGYLNLNEKYDETSYNEPLNIGPTPSEPLLQEAFPGSVFGTSSSVTIEWERGSDSDYSFLIRNRPGTLKSQGKVLNLNTTVQNINGNEMLQIQNTQGIGVHTFDVLHNNALIGSVKFAEKEPPGTCLKIHPTNANAEIVVKSSHFGDFAIFRDKSSPNPLCNIQIPYAKIYVEREFSGTIIFHPATEITTQEQLLCTAAAIAFKVTMIQLLKTKGKTAYFWGILCGIVIGISLIVLAVSLFGVS